MGFKCFCIKYRAIDIKSTSTSNLFSYISKDISAELVSFESEIGKDVEKVSVLQSLLIWSISLRDVPENRALSDASRICLRTWRSSRPVSTRKD